MKSEPCDWWHTKCLHDGQEWRRIRFYQGTVKALAVATAVTAVIGGLAFIGGDRPEAEARPTWDEPLRTTTTSPPPSLDGPTHHREECRTPWSQGSYHQLELGCEYSTDYPDQYGKTYDLADANEQHKITADITAAWVLGLIEMRDAEREIFGCSRDVILADTPAETAAAWACFDVIQAKVEASQEPTSLSVYRYTLCQDGWHSGSVGRGTCSWHGGIKEYVYEQVANPDYQEMTNEERAQAHKEVEIDTNQPNPCPVATQTYLNTADWKWSDPTTNDPAYGQHIQDCKIEIEATR
jgi:hypothetical protein